MLGSTVVGNKTQQRVGLVKIRILRCMCRMTREDRIINKLIRGSVGVAPIVDIMSHQGE